MDKVDLTGTAEELSRTAATHPSGRAARTVHGGHDARLRQTLLALAAGQELAEHANPGEATLHVLSGHVRVLAGSDSGEGRTGDLLVVPRELHSVLAVEDSTVLLSAVSR